ncbi:hypothetical protein CPS_4890 [Colwellia psychrerythraea 34H]|uniref:Uncharacterized protein n=1 Tax=Colwellia psychrerythraea (strain 34H / ATCC BAA-681) TaxID=167879 RepID=Q47UJ4_COLP3|nr:hypothetical protein CPS_4890 [Colwellia psychrerythraea 34H]
MPSTPLINKGVYEYRVQCNLHIPLCEIDELALMMAFVGLSYIFKSKPT